jgi:hypothetical protein
VLDVLSQVRGRLECGIFHSAKGGTQMPGL